MKAPIRSIQEIAHDAHEDLGSAQIVLSRLESLMFAALSDSTMSPHIRNLVDIAWNIAADGANTASVDFEAIGKALSGCAPQNGQSENVARDSEVHP
ncbi:hypothetical protein HX787_20370 [Pseudomonas tolaasii]|uniref:Uncharacterized protein n=1 Tax=Pseudomonas tolaasii TaxID=29442 RepID=A0A7Y8DR15_PSETO|nr:hypothetical protein [Pseudomonas tolaasii]NWC24048.1 hypothetical protein [Pseudomonas tolaasii]NWD38223.1 hypothetical protein [Pseudomonas tolaasii]